MDNIYRRKCDVTVTIPTLSLAYRFINDRLGIDSLKSWGRDLVCQVTVCVKSPSFDGDDDERGQYDIDNTGPFIYTVRDGGSSVVLLMTHDPRDRL